MRRGLTATLVAALLAWPQAADATPPTPREDAQARVITTRYWGGTPNCGVPRVEFGDTGIHIGLAYIDECRVVMSDRIDWASQGERRAYCDLLVHETGHLILGARYFEAVNPQDPAHAPPGTDPHSGLGAMTATLPDLWACDAMDEPPPPASRLPRITGAREHQRRGGRKGLLKTRTKVRR